MQKLDEDLDEEAAGLPEDEDGEEDEDGGDGAPVPAAPTSAAHLPVRRDAAEPPKVLVVFPLRRAVPFPGLLMPVAVEQGTESAIMEQVMAHGKFVGLLAAHDAEPPWSAGQFAATGVAAEILKRINLPDGNFNYVCRGVQRFKVERFLRLKEVPVARVVYPEDVYPPGEAAQEAAALERNVLKLAQKIAPHHPQVGEGFSLAAANIEPAGNLADFTAAYLLKDFRDKQAVLDALEIRTRLRLVNEILTRELVIVELGSSIQEEIRQRVEEQQKQFFLREQIKIIRRELGEEQDPQERDRNLFLQRLAERDYPEEVATKVREEVERLAAVPAMSPEYPVVRNYLEWLTELPWRLASVDRIDIAEAERILERDHYGLKEAKERILEFLGVRKLRPDHAGPILCFSGPPGVGKTSLATAIAESLGRKLERMSLGGMRDEAEIKGHRRTYVGALPGRILQMIRRAGTNNPVIVLDEIDKIGMDFRGDPASALLEVLDPAQNSTFVDHYLDLPFDLSKVMFIATANVLHTIPGPLRDRTEVIELSGYVQAEKLQIARRHLLPRQLTEHGLQARQLKLPVASLRALVEAYTQEAGVRSLDKAIAGLCRKRTLEIARGRRPRPEVHPADLEKYLGPAKYLEDRVRLRPDVGVALGLAYTGYGGDVLEIECVQYPGEGRVAFTGSLGDVMTESCRIAHAFLRSGGAAFGVMEEELTRLDLHVHFPAGAVPKDGPSAGIAITCAMLSRLTGRRLRAKVAMTGEITVTGEVLPVGGIREKVLTAKRRGVNTVLLPRENQRDVRQLDAAWTSGLNFVFVQKFEEVVRAAFPVSQ